MSLSDEIGWVEAFESVTIPKQCTSLKTHTFLHSAQLSAEAAHNSELNEL